jgi:arylsulfatase
LQPAFNGKPLNRKTPIFWEHESNRAVRDGKWKLVADENQPWELYDMEKDRTEMHDVAAKHPDIVKKMSAQWDAWAARADVLPLGAWHDAPKHGEKKKKVSKAKR